VGDELAGRSYISPNKKVDESWKDAVQKEKDTLKAEPRPSPDTARPAPKADPLLPEFLSTIAMQALLALGDAEHPVTGEKHEDLSQARFIIETLRMLHEKMLGNLTPDEESVMKDLLYDLQMRFVEKNKGAPA
jgi:hypothetical protein